MAAPERTAPGGGARRPGDRLGGGVRGRDDARSGASREVVPLTEREREIALLAASGHSSRAIAERLVLSVRTIDNHLGRIYDKLGVSNRAELAAALDRSPR